MSAALETGAAENVHSGRKVCRRPRAGDTRFFRPGRGGAKKGVLWGAPPKSSEGGLGKRSAQKTHALCVFGGKWRPWAPFSQTLTEVGKYVESGQYFVLQLLIA